MLTKKQLMERKKSIGGSDVAAILGFSPWKTALDVYLEKTTNKIIENNINVDDPRYWGSIHEESIIKAYEIKTGNEVKKIDTIYDKDIDFLSANLDGFTSNRIVIEAKSSSTTKGWGEEGTDQIPPYYLCQVAHYSRIADSSHAEIPVLFFGNKLKIYRYERNIDLEEKIKNKLIDFWTNNVIKKIKPNAQNLLDIDIIYEFKDEEIETNNEINILISEYKDILKYISNIKKTKDQIEMELKEFMGGSSLLKDNCNNKLISWKKFKRSSFDHNSMKMEYPDIYKKYLRNTEYRKFKVK